MKKFECDRCHAQQELREGGHSSAHIKIEPWGGFSITWKNVKAELCRDCASAVWDFITGGANPGESDPVQKVIKDWFGDKTPEEIVEILKDWDRQTTKGPGYPYPYTYITYSHRLTTDAKGSSTDA